MMSCDRIEPSRPTFRPAACATVAEVRKRGEDFWQEFEFYLSDLVVGLVLDVVLVGLMATPAVIGRHKAAQATGAPPAPCAAALGLMLNLRGVETRQPGTGRQSRPEYCALGCFCAADRPCCSRALPLRSLASLRGTDGSLWSAAVADFTLAAEQGQALLL